MSSSSGASSSSAPSLRIEPADATYKSLAALLSSHTASAASHLALLSPQTLSSSFTHYLATLPTADAAACAQLLVQSPALWQQGESLTTNSTSSGSLEGENAKSRATSLLARSQIVFEATARAVLGRIQVILNQPTSRLGFASRQPLVSWIKAIIEAVTIDAASIPSATQPVPLPSFALLTGLVAGLHAARSQKNNTASPRSLSMRYALRKAEEEWCIAFSVCMEMLETGSDDAREDESHEKQVDPWEAEFRKHAANKQLRSSGKQSPAFLATPHASLHVAVLYLTAQVSSLVGDTRLTAVPAQQQIISLLTTTMLGLFEHSGITLSLREDVRQEADGTISLSATSTTAKKARELQAHPLFTLLGPLSRLLSISLSNIVRIQPPASVHDILFGSDGESGVLGCMGKLTEEFSAMWLSSRLSSIQMEQISESSRKQTELLWNIFKTWLFSYTMVFDALMEAVVDVCPTPTVNMPIRAEAVVETSWRVESMSNINETYLNVVDAILMSYARMSWVTASFGSNAFDAYRRVFFEALEVLSRDNRASVAFADRLLKMIEVPTHPRLNAARRAFDTYILDVVEQIVAQLPDEMLQQAILPLCRPYLEDRSFQETFESAHSAVLSMFAAEKQFVLELAPYYANLLLESYPSHLKTEQLTYAFSTVVNAVSERSDTVAWHTLEALWSEIQRERYVATAASPSEPLVGASSATPATEREVALRDVYIAQIPNVNLVLLRSLLKHVTSLILYTDAGSEARLHLCEQTYSSLAGLDASMREEGVRWWLAQREAFGV